MSQKLLLIIVGVLCIILLGLGTVALALVVRNTTGQAAISPTATPTFPPTTAPTGKAGNKSHKVVGVIQSLGNQTFVVAYAHGKKAITVVVNDKTTYTMQTGPGSFTDLKIGQTVEVHGPINPQDQTLLAARIKVVTPTPTATPG